MSRVVLGVAAVTGALLAAPLSATATPHPQMPASPSAPTTSAQVQIVLARLAKSNEQLTEKYNLAQINVDKAQQAAAAAANEARQAKIALAVARRALANSLAAQYKGSSFSRTAALLASNSGQNYIEKMQSLNFLAMHQKEVSSVAGQALVTSAKAEANATSAVASAVAQRAEVAKQRDALSAEIDKQQKLFDSLSAAERAAFLARQAPAPTTTQLQSVTAAPAVATSKGAAAAVAAALSQRGKPYVWGAAGPDSYDCSGLTMWAWAQAGVSLPHQSAEQQALGTPVSQDQLQPGDLVFFGSPAYHVGMYIGNGMMVHAPTTGDVVKVSPLAYMSDYSGAARVG
jgi:cell wall-associated NlpC family hydrolase